MSEKQAERLLVPIVAGAFRGTSSGWSRQTAVSDLDNLKQSLELMLTDTAEKEDPSMKVALTGATGFIGSHVLAELQDHGHEVTALVRDDADAEAVAAKGATPVVVDLYDRPAVVSLLSDADGAIHTASPGDETSADLDSAVVDAAIEAFDGTGKPYLHITGAWVYGANPSITEESPIDAPAMVAWKEPIAQRVLDADGHARSRHRPRCGVRRRRRRCSRAAARLTP